MDGIIDKIKYNSANISKKQLSSKTLYRGLYLYEIIEKLFEYEKHFYKTGEKSDFYIVYYITRLSAFNQWEIFNIDLVVKFKSKYNKETYHIAISEILDRLACVNKTLNLDIKQVFRKITFDIQQLFSIRNTSLFLMLSEYLSDITIVKYLKNLYTMIGPYKRLGQYYISNYINIYLYEIVDNIRDDEFISKEIELFKTIIHNLYTLNCEYDITQTCKHLLFYKYKINISKKDKAENFCNMLLQYFTNDLNLLDTVEYATNLKFLQTGKIKSYDNNLELEMHTFHFTNTDIDIFKNVNLNNMTTYYTNILKNYENLIGNKNNNNTKITHEKYVYLKTNKK